MAITGNTAVQHFVPESWAKDVEFARDDAFVMAGLVNRKYESDLRVGDQVHIPFIGDLTTARINDASGDAAAALTPQAGASTEVILNVDQFWGTAVEIFDQTKVQSKYDLPKVLADRIGQALAAKVDTDLMAEYANVTAANDLTTVASVTYDNVVDAVSKLDEGNVPLSDRFMVVNAATLSDLRKDAQFVRYDSRGDMHAMKGGGGVGALGEIYGIPVYLSNNVATDTVPTPDDYANIIAHRDWLALAIQDKPELERDRNPLQSTSYLIGRVLYGIQTVRDDHAVVLRRQV